MIFFQINILPFQIRYILLYQVVKTEVKLLLNISHHLPVSSVIIFYKTWILNVILETLNISNDTDYL